jgi:hypothetical protein
MAHTKDAKTNQAIFSHHTSLYSRNRQPYGMQNDATVDSIKSPTTVTMVAASALSADITGSDAGTNGYATGAAEYMHLQIEAAATNETVTLYAYNYCFGRWAQLYLPVGIKNGADTTAELAHVVATFTSIAGRKMVTIPIKGIDRIAFIHDGTVAETTVVRAAASTF